VPVGQVYSPGFLITRPPSISKLGAQSRTDAVRCAPAEGWRNLFFAAQRPGLYSCRQ